ncbi:MAG: choice-of-anchor J domain-containing protein [Clostridia bacterium]|nr:choice-of-anchor J domain-containing protein [Clostridia bacterium]
MKTVSRLTGVFLALALLLCLLPTGAMTVLAESAPTVGDLDVIPMWQFTFEYSEHADVVYDSGYIRLSASSTVGFNSYYGYPLLRDQYAQLTITNTSGAAAAVSFDYEVNGKGTAYIQGYSDAHLYGSDSTRLFFAPGQSRTIVCASDPDTESTTLLWLSNFGVMTVTEDPVITRTLDFETDPFGNGFQSIDEDGDGNGWYWNNRYKDGDYKVKTGGCSIYSIAGDGLYVDNWLISHAVTIPTGAPYLTFWAATEENGVVNTFSVYAGKTADKDEMQALRYDLETSDDGSFMQYIVDISAFAGDLAYIAFEHTGASAASNLIIDDIDICLVDPMGVQNYYDIEIDGTTVNDTNRMDVLGNGVFRFIGDHTLLICGSYPASGDATCVIESKIDGLTVHTMIPSTINAAPTGMMFFGNTTITGDTLTVNASYGCAVYARDSAEITVRDTNLNAYGTYAITGANSGESLLVIHSTVRAESPAEGGLGAITDFGDMTLLNCEVETPTGGAFSNSALRNDEGEIAMLGIIKPSDDVGTLRGTITSVDFTPDADGIDDIITVKLLNGTGIEYEELVLGDTVEYAIYNVEPGMYTILVEKEGHYEYMDMVIIPSADTLTKDVALEQMPIELQKGDVDMNNVVNMNDAFTLYRAVSGQITLTDMQKVIGDMDNNGVINIDDAFSLYRKVSGGV